MWKDLRRCWCRKKVLMCEVEAAVGQSKRSSGDVEQSRNGEQEFDDRATISNARVRPGSRPFYCSSLAKLPARGHDVNVAGPDAARASASASTCSALSYFQCLVPSHDWNVTSPSSISSPALSLVLCRLSRLGLTHGRDETTPSPNVETADDWPPGSGRAGCCPPAGSVLWRGVHGALYQSVVSAERTMLTIHIHVQPLTTAPSQVATASTIRLRLQAPVCRPSSVRSRSHGHPRRSRYP